MADSRLIFPPKANSKSRLLKDTMLVLVYMYTGMWQLIKKKILPFTISIVIIDSNIIVIARICQDLKEEKKRKTSFDLFTPKFLGTTLTNVLSVLFFWTTGIKEWKKPLCTTKPSHRWMTSNAHLNLYIKHKASCTNVQEHRGKQAQNAFTHIKN